MTDRVYAAVTADIVGSTDYYRANGKPLRPRLLEALAKVNARHADALAVPFAITLGDEVQGLVSDPSDSPRIVYDLRLQFSPLKCRIGVGVGSVVSEMAESTAQMEGAAFSMSREALDTAATLASGLTVYRAESHDLETAVNGVSLLIDAVQSRWTDKQWEAVRLCSELRESTLVAKTLGISWQAVGYRLRGTRWQDVEAAVSSVAQIMDCLLRTTS